MSEQNKQIVRRFLSAFETNDTAVIRELVAADMEDHCAPPGSTPGIEGLLQAVTMFGSGFPDIKISIDEEVAEGDTVALFGTISGTNDGPFMGAPATGKRAAFNYMDLYRIRDGKIVEAWHVEDLVTMLGQLGHMPAPSPA